MASDDTVVSAAEVTDAIERIGGSIYMFPMGDKLVTECSRDELLVIIAQLMGEREYMQSSINRWSEFTKALVARRSGA